MLRVHQFTKPVFACLAALLVVAGCTVSPLYQSSPTQPGAQAVYAQTIGFAAPSNRVAQIVRNKLIFQLYGGSGEPVDATLKGTLAIKASTSGTFRTSTTSVGQTSAAVVTVSGTLTITDTTTGNVIEEFQRSAIAPIDRGNQQFANERAVLDAENRAGEELGEQFAALLASRVLR